MIECPTCGNRDQRYFHAGSSKVYCRKCIMFASGAEKHDARDWVFGDEEYLLEFPLTEHQKSASRQIVANAFSRDVLVDAVCGAGKTELVLETIQSALKNRKKVGWAIPRRQVVLELKERLTNIFTHLNVVAVCQGHTEITDGDLILCTTHQLHRYRQRFDVLILDEPDAFPYKGNAMLEHFAQKACVGNMIYLTATPDTKMLDRVKQGVMAHVQLYSRPHGHPLAEPKITVLPSWLCFYALLRRIRNNRQWLIFVPTRKLASRLSRILKVDYITSESENKESIIECFRLRKRRLLIATTILERGVTFEDIDVIVLFADHPVFDTASLIQISGRVGRSFRYPKGECLFLSRSQSTSVKACVRKIQDANRSAFGV